MMLGPAPSFARVDKFFGDLNMFAQSAFNGRPLIALSEAGKNWHVTRFPSDQFESAGAAKFAGGRLWLFGYLPSGASAALSTANGRDWDVTQIFPASPDAKYVTGLLKLGATYIAYGGDRSPRIWSSTNLASFTSRTDPATGDYFVDGAASPSAAALITDLRTIVSTADGLTYTNRTPNLGSSGQGQFLRWFEAAGLFIAGSTTGALATSPNATTWTARTSGATSASVITGGDGKYALGGNNGLIRVSTNLTTWSAPASVPSAFAGRVMGGAYIEGKILLIDAAGVIVESVDGLNFELVDSDFPFAPFYAFAAAA